ncbi:unnamed protein product, partial [Darwinula stevensoni]
VLNNYALMQFFKQKREELHRMSALNATQTKKMLAEMELRRESELNKSDVKSPTYTKDLLDQKMEELRMFKESKRSSVKITATRAHLAEVEKQLELGKRSAAGEVTSTRTRDLLDKKLEELRMLKESKASSVTITATRAQLAEVEKQLELEKRSAAGEATSTRTRDLLDRKLEELRLMKVATSAAATSTKTRDALVKVMRDIDVERDKLAKCQTLAEYQKQQALLQKMKEANALRGDTDVAFMLDCTGSMSSYIKAAKEHIKDIVDEIRNRYRCQVRVSFVGYRDHCDGQRRIETLDFKEDVNVFKIFLDAVVADGGGDTCEDVFGGLEAAINLSWSGRNKCLIHIGDAPPHGGRFHDLGSGADGDYSLNDSDRRGLRIEDLIQKIKGLGIDYTFGRINNSTDKMLRVFDDLGGSGFSRCSDLADVKNFPFVAIESISATIECNWKDMSGALLPKPKFSRYSAVTDVSQKSLKSFLIAKSQPRWNKVKTQPVKITQCEVSDGNKLRLAYKYRSASVKMSQHPFAEGSQRISYFGIEIGNSWFSKLDSKASVVLKTFKYVYADEVGDGRDDFINIVESQAIANYFAKEFNKVKPSVAKSIHFLDVKLVQAEAQDGSPVYYTIEDIFKDYDSEFKKFNSNFGFVNSVDFTLTLNAFSHWTYDHTKHYLMVVDLQGILDKERYVLTDPAIHCKELRFGSTNLGKVGMVTFFEAHECNKVCALMGLKSNRYMKDGTPNLDLAS